MVTTGNNLMNRIDQVVLILAMLFVLLMPVNKKIWYDETVSVLCSKGISHNTPAQYQGATIITNAELEKHNNAANVFEATVVDNSNSYLYNIKLHFFTNMFGNTINTYVLLSRLFAVCALICFYVLARKFISAPLFRAIAIFFLCADPIFWGMSIEIRAYMAGIFFICLSAIFLVRFLNENDSPANLFFTLLFSVAAMLTHFLTVYVLLIYALLLLVYKGKTLLSKKYILPVVVPVLLLGIFFMCSISGLQVMGKQNKVISEIQKDSFTYSSVLFNFLKFTAVNMKVVLPAFHPSNIIKILAAGILLIVYMVGRKAAKGTGQLKPMHMLLLLALSGSLFLTALSVAAGHNTPFYNRYFSFSVPFNCLFIAFFLQLLFQHSRSAIVKYAAMAFFIVPVAFLFYKGLKIQGDVKYSHTQIAEIISSKNMTDVEVQEAGDALLIHCFLPSGYQLNYHIVPTATAFKASGQNLVESVPIVRISN
jgi:hypothetical protein